jgi:division protein CdvB (Snf7/Vps24/ESCRT-III family)
MEKEMKTSQEKIDTIQEIMDASVDASQENVEAELSACLGKMEASTDTSEE